MTTKPEFTEGAAKHWMLLHAEEHADRSGSINATSLAESCADHFGVNDEGGPLDHETHWIWDLAWETSRSLGAD